MSNLTAGKLLIPYARLPRKKLTKFTGPQGRIDLIRNTITNLIKDERIEIINFVGYESRQYAERLIDLAKKYGENHVGMMEMADYWLMDKSLIPKLFKTIAPRYQNKQGPYTLTHKLPVEYPGNGAKYIVMELVGNSLPKIKTAGDSSVDMSNSLTNILLRAYRQNYYNKNKLDSSSVSKPATAANEL